MEESYKKRIRFNVSTSVKGIKTAEFTVEMVDATDEEMKAEIEKWAIYSETKYPVIVEVK